MAPLAPLFLRPCHPFSDLSLSHIRFALGDDSPVLKFLQLQKFNNITVFIEWHTSSNSALDRNQIPTAIGLLFVSLAQYLGKAVGSLSFLRGIQPCFAVHSQVYLGTN